MEQLELYPLISEQKALIPYPMAKERAILPLENGKVLRLAMVDVTDFETLQEMRLRFQKPIEAVATSREVVERLIETVYGKVGEEALKEFKGKGEGKKEEEGYDLFEQKDLNPAVRFVNLVLMEAIQQGASDLHFEPSESGLSLRIRIDGVLHRRTSPPKELIQQVLARIKVMAKMDVAEQRLPQDGRIKLRHGGREIDFRVSTLPTVYGERLVLRILDKGNVLLGLDRIGMSGDLLALFRTLLASPEGILLVTGPTGSGKTTSLYSAISELNAGELNIVTIEDPVEYKLPGISQMNVNPRIELDFAKGLRHILRQDPDVILIGEIRDKETAEIAIQASLTGHLVLTTLHTNDAPSALTRLVDMGIEPYLLASSVLGVLAQRLVRKICLECEGKGCPICYGSGYRGRVGVYELMPMNHSLKKGVIQSADSESLRKIAREQGMKTLFERGLELVEEHVTTKEEVHRVTRLIEER
jgi:general secretion pathway protein E